MSHVLALLEQHFWQPSMRNHVMSSSSQHQSDDLTTQVLAQVLEVGEARLSDVDVPFGPGQGFGSKGFDSLQCVLATSDQAQVHRCQTGMCT